MQLGNGGDFGLDRRQRYQQCHLDVRPLRCVHPRRRDLGERSGNQIGSGTTTLTGANTYSGGTTINTGTLQLGSGGTTGSIVGNVTDNGNFAFDHSDAITFGGTISGTGAVSQIGSGTLTLSGNNTYEGGTTLRAGAIAVGASSTGNPGAVSSGPLGTGTLTFDGGTLQTTGAYTIANTAAINTAGGTIDANGFGFTYSGIIGNGNGITGGLTIANTGGGAGGVVTLTNTETYSGPTTINTAATLALGIANAISASSGVTTNGTLSLGGFDQSIAALSGSGTLTNVTTYNTLTIAGGKSSTFSGGIVNGTGTTALTLTGAGTALTLSGSGLNTYAGTTVVGDGTNASTLIGGAANAFSANSSLTVNAGSTIDLGGFNQGAVGLSGSGLMTNNGASPAVLTINDQGGSQTTFDGIIRDGANTAGLTLLGLNTQLTLTGNNTYSGPTTIGDGANATTLLGGAANAFSPNSAVTVYASSTLNLGGFNQTIASLSGTGRVLNSDTAHSAATLTIGAAAGVTATFSGIISNGGSGDHPAVLTLIKTGASTQILAGANTYTGSTTVNGGTLTIATSGSVTSDVTNNATFNNAGTVTGSLTSTGTATNTGTITAGATVSGGTLTTTGTVNGGLTNSAQVNANGGAINGAVANNAGTFSVNGTVTSNSTFANAGNAMLAVGSGGSYTLQGLLTNSGVITVANGGQLIDIVGGITNTAGGSIIVAAGGTVRDDLNNAGTVTNGGAYFANVASNTGTITNNATWTGNVASSTGTLVNSAGAVWTGNINNGGSFTNAGTVTGNLVNSAGVTTNAGTVTGTATIAGGTLTGTGSTGALTIASGAMFAPGNGAPGSSATVNGNLAFQSAAQYLVVINPATASFATVTGTATPGNATVDAMFANGSYISKQYTILTATGGVSGMFAGVTNVNLPANFHDTLSYDATHAYLNLILNFAIPGGLNGNQQAVGNALTNFFNANGSIPMLYASLNANALSQVSGELATASQQTTFDAIGQFMGVMTDPFITGRDDGFGPNAAITGYAAVRKPADALAAIYSEASPPAQFEQRWSTWVAGYGGTQTTGGNAALGSNTATSRVYGTAVGADYRFSPFTIAGFALAGGGTNFSVAGSGSGHSDLFQAGAFIRHTRGPGLYHRRCRLWLAGHHHQSHGNDCRRRSVARRVQRQRFLRTS